MQHFGPWNGDQIDGRPRRDCYLAWAARSARPHTVAALAFFLVLVLVSVASASSSSQTEQVGRGQSHTSFHHTSPVFTHVSSRHELWVKENLVYHPSGVESVVRHKVAFADLDADSDFDMAVGEEEGRIDYYENIGDAALPEWRERPCFFADVHVETLGFWIAPAFADLDDDGDDDLVIGTQLGDLYFIENVGTPSDPQWGPPDTTLFQNVYIGSFASVPAFVDLDADDDLDLVLGERDPVVRFFENVGDPSNPVWEEDTTVFGGIYFGYFAAPALGDLDGDGDWDLVVGRRGGDLYYYYENTGTSLAPEWSLDTGMFAGIHIGWHSAPALVDLDADGDLDLIVGEEEGTLNLYSNGGTPYVPEWDVDTTGFAGIDVGFWSTPFLCDLDGDGDPDLTVGEEDGALVFFRNEGEGSTFRWEEDPAVYAGIEAGTFVAPALGDLDGDLDFDLVIGDLAGTLHCFENIGTAGSPVWSPNATLVPEVSVGADAFPRLVDGDRDGDLDLAVGSWDQGIFYYENVGTSTSPEWQEIPGIFGAVEPVLRSAPGFIDVDEDGDPDLVVGERLGVFHYYENVSADSLPVWVAGPPLFDGIDVGSYSIPAFVDIDGDGDRDLTYGEYAGNVGLYFNRTYTPAVQDQERGAISDFMAPCISASFPNPFRDRTTIVLSPGGTGVASLRIYDVTGRLVRHLGAWEGGCSSVAIEWDGRDGRGRRVASGPYFVHLDEEVGAATRKILLLR